MKLRYDIKYFIRNGKLTPLEDFPFGLYDSYKSVYEVVRYDGDFRFLESHIRRLKNSLQLAFPLAVFNSFPDKSMLKQFVDKAGIDKGNLRIEIFPQADVTLIFAIPHFYPPEEFYERGVDAVFQYDERPVKNAKVYNAAIRERADKIIAERKVFETVLVNAEGFMTEGSRSNIFFVEGNRIVTPPDEQVLPGITRENMIDFLKSEGIELEFRKIHKDELEYFEAMFFTGTSINALPCRRLENMEFDVKNKILVKVTGRAAE